MKNVVFLARPDEETVNLLKQLLTQAEAGELRSLVYGAEKVGGEMQHGYTPIRDRYTVIGQLDRMKYLVQRSLDADATKF